MNIMDFNLFSKYENLGGGAFFLTLANDIYWFIVILASIFGVFKVLEAGYQIIKKSNGGSPAYALVEHKQEIWEYVRGIVFLVAGATLINVIVNLFYHWGMLYGL